MADFAAGRVRVLVATTVIEVGVDVPNATLLIVQHAERFGLAQLHQLRGRVGRGARPGRALLIGDPTTPEGVQRLAILERTDSGFDIAEEDLRIRGAGEWLGTRQAGHLPELRLADLVRHGDTLAAVRVAAARLLATDPGLRAKPALRRRGRAPLGRPPRLQFHGLHTPAELRDDGAPARSRASRGGCERRTVARREAKPSDSRRRTRICCQTHGVFPRPVAHLRGFVRRPRCACRGTAGARRGRARRWWR